MLILLSQNEPGISAFIDLQKHMFPSGSSPMKSTFPWLQRQDVTYYKGEQLVWNPPTWNSLNIPVLLVSENVKDLLRSVIYIYIWIVQSFGFLKRLFLYICFGVFGRLFSFKMCLSKTMVYYLESSINQALTKKHCKILT
jgi:hypothetical protein